MYSVYFRFANRVKLQSDMGSSRGSGAAEGRPWRGETDAQTWYCRYCSCSEDDVLSAPDPSVSRRDEGIPYPIV